MNNYYKAFIFVTLALYHSITFAQDLLKFVSIEDAVRFVREEINIVSYAGQIYGSSEYLVSLPSGKKISNWRVNCVFSDAFRKFGKESIPYLIDFLGSDVAYLRIGAYDVLQQKAGRYDERSHSDNIEQRQLALKEWKAWWELNKNNPRLDSPPKRVYSADNWELQSLNL